jgi:hypothetical protein
LHLLKYQFSDSKLKDQGLNQLDYDGKSALATVIMNISLTECNKKRLKMIDLLLSQPKINLNSKDSKTSPLLWCLYKH